jgi:hypothetical protein
MLVQLKVQKRRLFLCPRHHFSWHPTTRGIGLFALIRSDDLGCLLAMEACASSHHWARAIGELGHEVRLIAPVYVSRSSSDRRTTWPKAAAALFAEPAAVSPDGDHVGVMEQPVRWIAVATTASPKTPPHLLTALF